MLVATKVSNTIQFYLIPFELSFSKIEADIASSQTRLHVTNSVTVALLLAQPVATIAHVVTLAALLPQAVVVSPTLGM